MVEKAACSGWGKVYFTGSTFADNPWDENTIFWDDLVLEVSKDIDITCPDSDESQMRIMVPLLPNPVPSFDGACLLVCFHDVYGTTGRPQLLLLLVSLSLGEEQGPLTSAGVRVMGGRCTTMLVALMPVLWSTTNMDSVPPNIASLNVVNHIASRSVCVQREAGASVHADSTNQDRMLCSLGNPQFSFANTSACTPTITCLLLMHQPTLPP